MYSSGLTLLSKNPNFFPSSNLWVKYLVIAVSTIFIFSVGLLADSIIWRRLLPLFNKASEKVWISFSVALGFSSLNLLTAAS